MFDSYFSYVQCMCGFFFVFFHFLKCDVLFDDDWIESMYFFRNIEHGGFNLITLFPFRIFTDDIFTWTYLAQVWNERSSSNIALTWIHEPNRYIYTTCNAKQIIYGICCICLAHLVFYSRLPLHTPLFAYCNVSIFCVCVCSLNERLKLNIICRTELYRLRYLSLYMLYRFSQAHQITRPSHAKPSQARPGHLRILAWKRYCVYNTL